ISSIGCSSRYPSYNITKYFAIQSIRLFEVSFRSKTGRVRPPDAPKLENVSALSRRVRRPRPTFPGVGNFRGRFSNRWKTIGGLLGLAFHVFHAFVKFAVLVAEKFELFLGGFKSHCRVGGLQCADAPERLVHRREH